MVQLPSITPPTSIGEALNPLATMGEEEFALLMSSIHGDQSFSLSKEQIDEVQKRLPSVYGNLAILLGLLSFLYSHVDHYVEVGVPYPDVIEKLTSDLSEDATWKATKDLIKQRLLRLLERKEVHSRYKKIQRLQSGFIPNAKSFASFVDLRPDFTDETPVSVKGFLKTIQVRIRTDARPGQNQEFVFQLTEDALKEMKKCIDRTQEKLSALQMDADLSTRYIKG